ncbi:MAG: hypothetical protein ACNI27_07320 [Desulfovibrio sp.]
MQSKNIQPEAVRMEGGRGSENTDGALIYRGAKEICSAVGENRKKITVLVEQEGLPAFKRVGSSQWLLLHEDLMNWLREQRDKYREK